MSFLVNPGTPTTGAMLLGNTAGEPVWAAPPRLVDVVAEFGVDNTGTVHDNSTLLTQAIATLATEGLTALVPPQSNGSAAVVNIANIVTFGNGNQSTGKSSIQGGGLVGAGFTAANFIQANSNFAQGLTVINWTGASGSGLGMFSILGPLWGWHLENLYFTSSVANASGGAVWNHGGCGGLVRNCAVDSFTGTGFVEDVSVSTLDLDNLFNEYDHVFVNVPNGQVGLYLGPNSLASQNICFNWYHDMWINKPASPSTATYSIYDNGSDTDRFDRIYSGCVGSNSYGYHAHAGGGYTPGGHIFTGCDFNSQSGGISVSVAGGNIGANGPITFRSMGTANGLTTNPHLPGIIWSCPESPARHPLWCHARLRRGLHQQLRRTHHHLPDGRYHLRR